MVQRAVLLLVSRRSISPRPSPGELPCLHGRRFQPASPAVAAFAGDFCSDRKSRVDGVDVARARRPVRGRRIYPRRSSHLAVKGDAAGKNATEATRLRLEAGAPERCRKLLDFMASADEMVSLTSAATKYLGADLSKLGQILEPFPAIEPEWNCSLSTQTTVSTPTFQRALRLPTPPRSGTPTAGRRPPLQVAGSKDLTYAPVSERHDAPRMLHQSRALVREHATLDASAADSSARRRAQRTCKLWFSAPSRWKRTTRPPAGLYPAGRRAPPVTLEVPARCTRRPLEGYMIAIASNCASHVSGRKCLRPARVSQLPPAPGGEPNSPSVFRGLAATAGFRGGALRASPERTTKQGLRAALISVLGHRRLH